MKTLEHINDQPLEGLLSDYIQRELAVVGALHASLAVLKVATDIGALSGEELETIDAAAEAILTVHGFCLARADSRAETLTRVREAMETVKDEVTEELPMLGGGDHVRET